MAWGKNRRSSSASSSSASSSSRPSSSAARGGRRRPPGEPTEQDIARSIQQSAVRVRVALQLGAVEGEAGPLRGLLAEFEQLFEARRGHTVTQRHDVRVELLECGLNSWQHLVELQRVLAGLKRPTDRGEEGKVMTKTMLKRDPKYDEWTLSLGFARPSEDALWRFASSLMLRLKSCGVPSRVLLAARRLMVVLETAFVEWGNTEIDKYQWEGEHVLGQVVVEVPGEQREEIQRVFLPPVLAVTGDPRSGLRYPDLEPLVDNMLRGSADARKPVVVILRGIPGSGKSTIGREIEAICRHRGVSYTACSADFFFETQRGYLFDVKKLGAAHSKCKGDFTRAIQEGTPRNSGDGKQRRPHQHVVLVDNTSTQRWEYEPYEAIARSHGSRVHIVEMKCADALMAFRMGQRNSHGVPPDKVVSMFMRWEEDPRAHCFTPQFEHTRLTANPLSDGDVGGLTYLGLFLDDDSQQKLLTKIPPAHPNRLADHVTLFYRPNNQYTRDAELGAPFTIRGVEIVQNEGVQTLRVELDERLPWQIRNKIPHITLSTVDGVSASYSNDLLECTSAKRTMLNPPIECTGHLGAALFIQNQRVITTSPPFAGDVNSCSKNTSEVNPSRANGEKEQLPDKSAAATSRLFVLYVNEGDLMSDTEEDTTKLLWRAQILHHMGAKFKARRLLCVQRSQVSSPSSLTTILSSIQDRFLLSSTNVFDDVTMLQQPSSVQGFEKALNEYVAAAGFGPINQLTLMTSVEESMQWSLCKMKCLQGASLSVVHFGHPGNAMKAMSALSPDCSTIPSALDLLGINIQEESRSAIFGGMSVVNDVWARVLGSDDRQAVQRIDTTLPGLTSIVVELCLMLPSGTASSEVEVLEMKLLSALESTPSVDRVVRSCVPGQFYFSLCTASIYAPEFCVRMAIESQGSKNAARNTIAQFTFCECQLRTSREACDVEAYSVLVALLRAILLGRCSKFLPSQCRSSSLINLASERLVLRYLDSIDDVDGRPTANDVTSGRIIFALYGMLRYLSMLSSGELAAAFGDPLLVLQGNENAQTTWSQAMDIIMQNCIAVMASHRCVGECLTTAIQLNPNDHLRVVVALMKPDITEAACASPTRTYIEVPSRSTWSPLHSLACCDKLRNAAAMVLPQDDDDYNGDSPEFFSCAPSLVARRVDVTASSLDLLRNVLNKLHALEAAAGHDSEGALCSDYYVIRGAETDEEVLIA
ncbi:NEDD4-binding protein 2 [Phytophthora pseudosyringae]|uniref:NEDD4-binding protein 2 n=1 Tax=Phytophthora pseudosyringae TaxID=221518 RepID=A0A8T1VLA1_9STRA|nr:NEDD4-binding protein 2 [Phytophthora pseudosyringae]